MSRVEVPVAVRSRYYGRQVRAAAVRLLENLDARRPGVVGRLRADPFVELHGWSDEVAVRRVPIHSLHGGCSVIGQYSDDTDPPTLSVLDGGSSGQRRFTVLHELGHHEQRGDLPWFDAALAKQSDNGRRLEEQVCDSFAAEVLLGQDVVDRVLGEEAPSAESVLLLREETGASRAACCVRVAQLLRCEGLVILTDLAGEVLFAAVNGSSFFRPKRGTAQGSDSLAVRAAALGRAQDPDAFLQYATGTRLIHLRGEAIRDGNYVYVVLRDGRAPWQKTDLGPRAAWDVPARNCAACGEELERPGEDPCPQCRRPRCSGCGARCECGRLSGDKTCSACSLSWSRTRFPGDGDVCADCV